MKRILFLLLLMGNVCVALADDVTCFLPQDKRIVVALPEERLTLGVPDPNSGRTVCYRWSSEDCSNCFDGPTDQPTVDVVMPSQIGTYHFTVKRISDHIQTCNVTVTVESSIEIISISPLLNCYSDDDDISENQFKIITNPAGLERNVRLDDASRKAKCPAYTRHNYQQTLTFRAYKNGNIVDYKYVDVTVYAEAESTAEVSIPPDIQNLITQLRGAVSVLNYLREVDNTLGRLMNKVPGAPSMDFSIDEPSINVSVKASKDICCQGKTNQSAVDLSIAGSAGAKWTFYYPLYMLGIPCPPTLNFQGQIGLSGSLDADVSINQCIDPALDIDVSLTAFFSGGISWGRYNDILYGAVTAFAEPSLTGTWHVLPLSNFGFSSSGDITFGFDLMYSSSWFSDEKHVKVSFFTWHVY